MNTNNNERMRKMIVRVAEAEKLLGISKSTIWARANPKCARFDPDFPAIFPLHSNSSGKGAVGMFLDDIEGYLEKHRDQAISTKSTPKANVEDK